MTTKRTLTSRTAMDAYMDHHAAIMTLLARITEAVANHDVAGDPDAIDWGHVGDAVAMRGELQEISDRIFHEGEYATIGCTRCDATFAWNDDAGIRKHHFANHR